MRFLIDSLILLFYGLKAKLLAEVPNLLRVACGGVVPVGVVGKKFYCRSVFSIAPHFLVACVSTGCPVVGGLLVVLAFVQVLCQRCNIATNVPDVILEYIVSISMAMNHIDGLGASLPLFATKGDAAGGCKGCNLIDCVCHAVIDECRTHGET